MLRVIRSAKRSVQVKKVAYDPNLFKLLFIHDPHPTEKDESDDIEKEKRRIKTKFLTDRVAPLNSPMNAGKHQSLDETP